MRIPPFSLPKQPKLEWVKRMTSWQAYEKHHSQEFPRMWDYWDRDAKGKSYQPSGVKFEWLPPDHARYLYAINMQSRMDFTRIVHCRLDQHFDQNDVLGGHWITLAPPQYFYPIGDVDKFNLNSLSGWVRTKLAGLNYIGMLDLALWYFAKRGSRRSSGHVSFHVHVIA